MTDQKDRYMIATINDLFNVVTANNIDRLVLDLNHMLYVISKLKNNADIGAKFILPNSFEWIDDSVTTTEIVFKLTI